MNQNFFDLSKKKQRDVLTELLTERPFEGLVSKKELMALIRLIGETSQHKTDRADIPEKDKKKPGRTRHKKEKKQSTCYLSHEVFRSLDRVTREIKTIMPENQRAKITKSHVINQAVSLMLEEYKTRGRKSRLFRSILQEH